MTRKPHAFTLIELLIAMAMASMIALTLYVGMNTAFRARRTSTAQITAMRQASVVIDLVARDLQSVPRPNGELAGPFLGTTEPAGASESATINFYGFADEFPVNPPASEGMRQIEFTLRTNVTPHVLVRRVQRNLLAQSLPEPEEEVLATGVRSFGVRYYDGTDWLDTWDSTAVDNQLPLAVELLIELEAGTAADPTKPYRISRIVPLPCGTIPTETTTVPGTTPGGG